MTDTNGNYTINKNTIIKLLDSTNLKGRDILVHYMEKNNFFDSPASTKYHGCYEGGLAEHSLNVYCMFRELCDMISLDVDTNTAIITCLLHDICKMGAYIPIEGSEYYSYNKQHPKGHALLSIERIKKFIGISPIEEKMIKYHMGMYGTVDFSEFTGEYGISELIRAYNENPVCKILYLADELATQKEKIQEEKNDRKI